MEIRHIVLNKNLSSFYKNRKFLRVKKYKKKLFLKTDLSKKVQN